MEALRAEHAQRAEPTTTVFSEQSVRVVLDDRDPVTAADVEQRVHLAGDAGVVQRDDRLCALRDRALHARLVQIQRVGPHVAEHRLRAAHRVGQRGRDESERGHDHFTLGVATGQEPAHLERVRAVRRQQDLARAQRLLEQLVTGLREVAVARDVPALDRLGDVALLVAGEGGLVERDAVGLHRRSTISSSQMWCQSCTRCVRKPRAW